MHRRTWVTRREVAEARGVSVDTVKRDERRHRYRTRCRPGDPRGVVEICYEDVVAAGHVDEEATVGAPPAVAAGDASVQHETQYEGELRVQIARLEAERDQLQDALAHARADVTALQQMLREALSVGRQG